MAGKYTPLEHYLRGITPGLDEVSLSFEKIEQVLGASLPPSAHRHQAWWANEADGRHVHAHAWMNAGWRVDFVDQGRRLVRFRRA
jgi:hypothetical protein